MKLSLTFPRLRCHVNFFQDSPHLAERECISAKEVFGVVEALSSTLIFASANAEERLALGSRLRHWAVEDGTYLIREGDGDRHRSAVYMIGGWKLVE